MKRPPQASTQTQEPVSADPLDWRPQRPRPLRVPPVIHDAILEPDWSGTHVLVHFDAQRGGGRRDAWIRVMDEQGNDATDRQPAVVDEIARSVMAIDAVLDGYLTTQATRPGEGTTLALRPNVRPFPLLLPHDADVDVVPDTPPASSVAFVAVDLLRLDGQDLLDLPLLERKRLLEAVLAASELVRVTPFARPPIAHWFATWKSAGFGGVVGKAANSRYRPGSFTNEWAVYTKLR
jgi:bifunctional non-homologous end joining protein LigD